MWANNPFSGCLKAIVVAIGVVVAAFLSLCGGCAEPTEGFHNPYADTTHEVAGAPAIKLLTGTCFDISVAAEALQFFRDNTKPRAACYNDVLDESWACKSVQQNYSVKLVSAKFEAPLTRVYRVEPAQAPNWKFSCAYDSQCNRISCRRL